MKGKKRRRRKRKKLDFVWSSSKFNKDKRKPTHDKNPNPHCFFRYFPATKQTHTKAKWKAQNKKQREMYAE